MIKEIFSILEKDHQPTMLEQFSNYTPFQQIVITLLSSRTKDSTTIPLAKKLFAKYPNPENFINLKQEQLEQYLFGIGFYKVKTKHIKELSKIVLEKGIPDDFAGLTSLPGVGRKTANCVLNYTFNKPAVAVDIHVHRITNRLGWIKTNSPEETEEELMKLLPKELWSKVNMLFVDHGQRVCLPVKPRCKECRIREFCAKNL